MLETGETDEDFEIWVGLMAWWHKRHRASGVTTMRGPYADADRNDMRVMAMMTEIKRDLPHTRAVAHSLLRVAMAETVNFA